MKDHQILELIKDSKHDKAIKALFKFFPSVRKIVKQYKGNQQDAEDIFQEGLIIFYQKVELSDFVLTSSVQTYLVAICKNLMREKQRKQARFSSSEINFEIEESEYDEAQESKFLLIEETLKKLGEKCMQILQLYYFDKRSMNEIATKLEYTSVNSAKNQKYKCLERARKMVKESMLENETSSKSIWS